MDSSSNAMWPLELRLFGAFDVRIGGQPLGPLRYRKEQWLLALLALRHDRDVARDWLAATFWPDNDEKQAMFYLRKALSNLRNALGDEAVRLQSPSTRTVRLDLSGAFADYLVFDAAISRPPSAPGREDRLREAIELYRGPLLHDCSEDWVTMEREQRGQAYLSALEEVAEAALRRGEAPAASRWLRLALTAEPYRESAACGLMRALAESGDRAALRQVYQDLRMRLRSDLNSVPSPETEALYKRLSQHDAHANPPTALGAIPGNTTPSPASLRHLPVPLTDLIGRDAEIAEVAGWLERGRLVTLLGPGGVGKTRLSIAAADIALPRFSGGVWFVDLAPIADAAYVSRAMTNAFGLQPASGQTSEDLLIERLGASSLLLVLDNCEHLIDTCAAIADLLLSACSGLRILATSRQALGLTGEQVYPVPSLALPLSEELRGQSGILAMEKDPACLMDYAGIRLFVQRAAQVNPSFRLDRRNGLAVAEVCRHLDGIPLAIELAAARVRSLSVNEISGKLDQRFRLLTGGSRAALPRQRTLRALIDWSYDLLSDAERTLLCQVSVFAGGWTLEAAEGVCAGGVEASSPSPVPDSDVLDLLTGLVDKSLVQVDTSSRGVVTAAGTRYRLLDTVRQYANERLRESGLAEAVRDRHRDFFVALAEQAAPELVGPEQGPWFDRLETDHDNLRAALETCAEGASIGASTKAALSGLRLALALSHFWWTRGYLSEARVELSRALGARHVAEAGANDGVATAGLIARTLNSAGIMAGRQSDYAAAQSFYGESITLNRSIDDAAGVATGLHNLGLIAYYQGNYPVAQSSYEECVLLYSEIGNKLALARTLENLATVFRQRGDYAMARLLLEQSIEGYRETGHRMGLANARGELGLVIALQGDIAAGLGLQEESLTMSREIGDKNGVAGTLIGLGFVAIQTGQFAEAETMYAESLRLTREIVDRRVMACGLEGMAACAVGAGDARRAVIFFAGADVFRKNIGAPLPPIDRVSVAAWIAKGRAALGDEAFASAWAAGAAMPPDLVVATALGESVLK